MQPRKIMHYVAVGDSLTEGIWNWGKGDRHAGFAYLLADQLRHLEPRFDFHNLGVGGARTVDVLQHQVERAIHLKPDFLTLLIGANDVPTTPQPLFREQYEQLIERLYTGVKGLLLVGNIPNAAPLLPTQLTPFQGLLTQRVQAMNGVIRQATQRYALPLVDLYANPATADRRNVSKDGLHPNPRGYRLLAQAFAELLDAQTGLDVITIP